MCDVVMPRAGGRPVAERLVELHPGLKVLYVSGHTDDAVVRHGVRRDGVNFRQKPFRPVDLAHNVRKVLDATASRNGVGAADGPPRLSVWTEAHGPGRASRRGPARARWAGTGWLVRVTPDPSSGGRSARRSGR